MIYVVMGVSGAGKTLIGKQLADALTLSFYDGDDFHPVENVRKMESGQPLNDEDRWPWLDELARNMDEWQQDDGGAVLACSALKKSYRNHLRSSSNSTLIFIYLKGSKELIAQRLKKREGHYMPADLLDSQFEALEEPRARDVITVSVDQSPEKIIREIREYLKAL